MSMPAPGAGFRLEPAGVEALAAELRALGAELAGDADAARSAAVVFPLALDGEAGWCAGASARAWASVEEVLARRAGAVAETLVAAVAAYRAEDEALAAQVGMTRPRGQRAPR
jgi:hypothetical protein